MPRTALRTSTSSAAAPASTATSRPTACSKYSLAYEGTKHTIATDVIRRGVPERALQRLLGHASVQSTRRYARLADNALIEVLRPPAPDWRQLGDKGSRIQLEKLRGFRRVPSWIRRRTDRPSGREDGGEVERS